MIQEYLIEMLKPNAMYPEDLAWNKAVITVLQRFYSKPPIEGKTQNVPFDRTLSPILSEPELNRIAELLREGHKLQAVKIFKDITGLGLKESKDAMDAYQERLREFDDQ